MRFIFLLIVCVGQCFLLPDQAFLQAAGCSDAAHPKIIVVGAGLSGLTTAHRLQKIGHPVEVYEARGRPGGRVLTAYFGNAYEELGGKNIDDAFDADEMLALISELGLKVRLTPKENLKNTTYVFDGKMGKFVSAFKEGPEPTEALLETLRSKLDQMKSLGDVCDLLLGKHPKLYWYMGLIYRGYEGSTLDALSPYYLDISFWNFYSRFYEMSLMQDDKMSSQDPHLTVDGGNSCLVKALAKQLDGHIHYNLPLRGIARGCTHSYKLIFDNGVVVETDYLVLTLPCSTLRDVKIEEGLIPDDQLYAIKTLQYGSHAKLLIPVKLKDNNQSQSIITESIYSWFNHDKTIMTWYMGGNEAIFDYRSSKELCKILNRDIDAIRKVFPDIEFPKGLLPCPKSEITSQYDQPIGVSWINDEFSKGGYSNHGIHNFKLFHDTIEDHGEVVFTIFRSVNGTLFFAGEHTALVDFATMGGAVQSGERAARMLDNALENAMGQSNAEARCR